MFSKITQPVIDKTELLTQVCPTQNSCPFCHTAVTWAVHLVPTSLGLSGLGPHILALVALVHESIKFECCCLQQKLFIVPHFFHCVRTPIFSQVRGINVVFPLVPCSQLQPCDKDPRLHNYQWDGAEVMDTTSSHVLDPFTSSRELEGRDEGKKCWATQTSKISQRWCGNKRGGTSVSKRKECQSCPCCFSWEQYVRGE